MKYDDASYYGSSDEGATHIGIFLAWAIARGLTSKDLSSDDPGVRAVIDRTVTGTWFLLSARDGKLLSEDLGEEGNAFATAYYLRLQYLEDFTAVLGDPQRTADSWANFDLFAPVLDLRYQQWKNGLSDWPKLPRSFRRPWWRRSR